MSKGHNIIVFNRLCLFIVMGFFASSVFPQYYLKIPPKQGYVYCNCYYDGYWGKETSILNAVFYGDYHSFIVYNPDDHPSEYRFKVTIDNYHKPSKSEVKMSKYNNDFITYTGTVEYYVNEEYPTIKDGLKKFYGPWVGGGTHPVKRVAKATIGIENFNNHPKTYNILFDEVGFAIFLYKAEFK